MAQKFMLVCDLHDDDDEVGGVETVSFGVDGATFEIDVCQVHAEELRDSFARYSGVARSSGRAAASTGPRRARADRPTPDSAGGRQHVQEVREWARANGHTVSDRGRLSGAVIAAYEAAH